MKLNRLSQLFLVSGVGLGLAALLTGCQLVTIDYLYVAGTSSASGSGAMQILAVDSQSGAVRFAAGTNAKTSVATGGTLPVSMAVTPNYANLYVANAGNNTLVHFAIATDGTLSQKDKVTLPDVPVAIAVNQAGTYLYALSGTTSATLTEYALSSGAIGSATSQQTLTIPGFTGDTVVPTALTVLPNNSAVFATVYDQSAYNPGGTTTSTANPGWIFSFGVGSGGVLTASTRSPYKAGVKPSGLVADPASRFVYVTDYASNQMIGYGVFSGSVLNFLISGPYKTGNQPTAVAVDPRGRYLYVSNALDSSVSAYALDITTGVPSLAVNTTGSQTNTTDTQPVAILVDPALGRFVYTANHIGSSISGFRLDPNTGTLTLTQATPYPTLSAPTSLVCIPHGNHSLPTVLQ